MTAVTVVLATTSCLYSNALSCALAARDGFQVVGEVHDVTALVAAVRRSDPVLAVVAADLSGAGGGIGACAEIARVASPPTALLVLGTGSGSEEEMLRALEAGAQGYVTEDSSLTEVVEDMVGVLAGEARVPRGMLGAVLRDLVARQRRGADQLGRYAELSRRERETLALLADGRDHHQIAEDLVISPETARTHIQRVITKLGVHSRLEAATLAIDNGWVTPRKAEA